jgi:hypothetical protein
MNKNIISFIKFSIKVMKAKTTELKQNKRRI